MMWPNSRSFLGFWGLALAFRGPRDYIQQAKRLHTKRYLSRISTDHLIVAHRASA